MESGLWIYVMPWGRGVFRGRGPWEERVANSCAFGLAGYLSNEKESAGEGVEVEWCLVLVLGRL